MISFAEHIGNAARAHHACLVVGDPDRSLQAVRASLAAEFSPSLAEPNNPDVIVQSYELFGINDSRALKALQSRRAAGSHGTHIILIIPAVMYQAQNALLKILEEPMADIHFFILTRHLNLWLPTVVSRCAVVLEPGESTHEAGHHMVEQFLAADLVGRHDITEAILKEHKDGEKNNIRDFLIALLEVYRQSLGSERSPAVARVLGELDRAVVAAGEPGSSSRLLLEYLAGIIPIRTKV